MRPRGSKGHWRTGGVLRPPYRGRRSAVCQPPPVIQCPRVIERPCSRTFLLVFPVFAFFPPRYSSMLTCAPIFPLVLLMTILLEARPTTFPPGPATFGMSSTKIVPPGLSLGFGVRYLSFVSLFGVYGVIGIVPVSINSAREKERGGEREREGRQGALTEQTHQGTAFGQAGA